MAWAELKNTISEHFGYIFAGENNGMVLVAFDHVYDLQVFPANNNRNPQFEMTYRTADHKPTGKKVRLYAVERYRADIEIVCGDKSEIMSVREGRVSFN
ncbi:hypothetical protein D3C74_309980 [compost metagenome]